MEWKVAPVKECSGLADATVPGEETAGRGFGAIDRDITARLIARTLKNMDCLAMAHSTVISRMITAAEGNWLRIATKRSRSSPAKPQTI